MTFKTIFNFFNINIKFMIVGIIPCHFKASLTNIKKKQVKIERNQKTTKYFHKALFKDLKVQKQSQIGAENG